MKLHYTQLVAYLLLVALLAACTGTSDLSSTQNARDANLQLVLSINSAADSYRANQPISVTLTLKNAGTEAILVNSRMVWSASFSPDSVRDVVFTIKSPSGRELEYVDYIKPVGARFTLLQPGEFVEHTYDLYYLYGFTMPGEYMVQAIYQNQTDPKDTGKAWKGEVRSNSITFVLEP